MFQEGWHKAVDIMSTVPLGSSEKWSKSPTGGWDRTHKAFGGLARRATSTTSRRQALECGAKMYKPFGSSGTILMHLCSLFHCAAETRVANGVYIYSRPPTGPML